jgi:hypothetical protein
VVLRTRVQHEGKGQCGKRAVRHQCSAHGRNKARTSELNIRLNADDAGRRHTREESLCILIAAVDHTLKGSTGTWQLPCWPGSQLDRSHWTAGRLLCIH